MYVHYVICDIANSLQNASTIEICFRILVNPTMKLVKISTPKINQKFIILYNRHTVSLL